MTRYCRRHSCPHVPHMPPQVTWKEGCHKGSFYPKGAPLGHLRGRFLQGIYWLDDTKSRLVAVAYDNAPPGWPVRRRATATGGPPKKPRRWLWQRQAERAAKLGLGESAAVGLAPGVPLLPPAPVEMLAVRQGAAVRPAAAGSDAGRTGDGGGDAAVPVVDGTRSASSGDGGGEGVMRARLVVASKAAQAAVRVGQVTEAASDGQSGRASQQALGNLQQPQQQQQQRRHRAGVGGLEARASSAGAPGAPAAHPPSVPPNATASPKAGARGRATGASAATGAAPASRYGVIRAASGANAGGGGAGGGGGPDQRAGPGQQGQGGGAEDGEQFEPTGAVVIRTMPWLSLAVVQRWFPDFLPREERFVYAVRAAFEIDGVLHPDRCGRGMRSVVATRRGFSPAQAQQAMCKPEAQGSADVLPYPLLGCDCSSSSRAMTTILASVCVPAALGVRLVSGTATRLRMQAVQIVRTPAVQV